MHLRDLSLLTLRTSSAAALITLMCATSACEEERGSATPVSPEVPATRAATSFSHCLEATGANCVGNHAAMGAWDAFSMLGWLGGGSPNSILSSLNRELAHHTDIKLVQNRFATLAGRLREPLRGAECRSVKAHAFSTLIPPLAQAVEQRMTALGLWRDDLAEVVTGLVAEADKGLSTGYLVQMTCASGPGELWIPVAMPAEGGPQVLGVMTSLPRFLGGEAPSRDAVERRMDSTALMNAGAVSTPPEGQADRWLAVPITDL